MDNVRFFEDLADLLHHPFSASEKGPYRLCNADRVSRRCGLSRGAFVSGAYLSCAHEGIFQGGPLGVYKRIMPADAFFFPQRSWNM